MNPTGPVRRLQPFIAVPLCLLAAACSSSQFNSELEAEIAARDWESESGSFTVKWEEKRSEKRARYIDLTPEEYERRLKINNEAALRYAEELNKRRDDDADRGFWRIYPSQKGKPLTEDSPQYLKDHWRRIRNISSNVIRCIETNQIVCVTHEKIAGRLPAKYRKESFFEEVTDEKSMSRVTRDCTQEDKIRQFVCWSLKAKDGKTYIVDSRKEANQFLSRLNKDRAYKYFRY